MPTTLRCLALGLLAVFVVGEARAVEIRDVRLWAGPDHTRVVVELSGPATHNLFTLHNPERVVVDVADASLAATPSAPSDGMA